MTCIENFSDEIFHEIFDYLDGCHIYEAFSNLNHRFEQLLNSPLLLFKIDINETVLEDMSMDKYKSIILINKQKIISIELSLPHRSEHFFSSFIIDSLFYRLESFVINWIDSNLVIPLLVNLASLPRLVSLTIGTEETTKIIDDIYRLIFALPALKYNSFSTTNWRPSISLPMATNRQFSTIETLVINHHCTFDDLAYLTSYTPKLRHLNVSETSIIDSDIETMLPMNLPNLTDIHIDLHSMTFNELEMIMIKLGLKLNVLHCFVVLNAIFLDGHRWKQFILQYLPDLKKFYLKFKDLIHHKHQHAIYSGEPNQFTSSFWIERRWILEFIIMGEEINYSIHPYRYIEK
jgi:hypothetical protein